VSGERCAPPPAWAFRYAIGLRFLGPGILPKNSCGFNFLVLHILHSRLLSSFVAFFWAEGAVRPACIFNSCVSMFLYTALRARPSRL
jgi:hypothetical protein